ncbi:hypothetical protein FSW04_25290 [Baekduia soli]|uniref:Uncharacterized protein n=1 Tax=Baekduia soli TaxID=496014 RepID=A0A5B8UC76_9ACTN|nr:hypothetical protein [Baekduia soli]QEC50574.1 hypothetical protein FSW04_25290 [Baekduia soli]
MASVQEQPAGGVRWSVADVEALHARGLTDGLPVIPPAPELVAAFVAASGHPGDEVVAVVPPLRGDATVTVIAANAVMAGCRPEHAPVVLAGVRAMSRPEFNLYGVRTSHHPATPLFIVSGPAADTLGFNASKNLFGPASRANAAVGRALNLIVQNVGGATPQLIDPSVMGHPGRYTYCIAEHGDGPWPAMVTEEAGLAPGASAIGCFAADAPTTIVDYASNAAADLLGAFAFHVANVWRNPFYLASEILVLASPAHARVLAQGGADRATVLARLAAAARAITGPLVLDEHGFDYAGGLRLAVAGGPDGQYSALVNGWVGGDIGSVMTIEEIT